MASGGAPAAGTSGSSGSSDGGSGESPATTCIEATSTRSAAIPTVHTVTFTTTLEDLTSAQIEFGPAETAERMLAPVDLTEESYKTYLVGMKPDANYVYRVKVASDTESCTSEDYPITTGTLEDAPEPTVEILDADKHDRGFIVVSTGIGGRAAYIIDPDGTVVWVAPSGTLPNQPSRAHLSWDAKRFIMMSTNNMNSRSGRIYSVAMDGTDLKMLSGVEAAHHDFTAIPGGIATVLWNEPGTNAPCSLVEFPDDGAPNTVIADLGSVYNSSSFHTNALHYYAHDDSYTIGDRTPDLFVKVTRSGELVWQFGGENPKDEAKFFTGVATWTVNHGHHLLADGTFVFYNNGPSGMATTFVYKLDTETMTATQEAMLTGNNSLVLGDAQSLPNGNVLITGSTSGTISERTLEGDVVMTVRAPSGQQFAYSEFRESLYGPPPY